VELVIRAAVVYLLLLLLMRGLRKRTLGEMSPFEMIILVAVGDMIQQGVTQEDYSLTGAFLVLVTWGFLISGMSWLTYRSTRARRAIEGVPMVVVDAGEVIQATLDLEQVPLEELMEAARQQGIADLAEVQLGVLEVSGKFSFIKRA
jgi:uncharacterized membrane protein YcaP (DUF421 family)